jgi:Uma2 family endonuclease
MAAISASMLTKDDYRQLPDSGPRFQLIEGELYMSPAPNRFHQDISRNIEFMLLKYLEQQPIGELYHAPFDVYLSDYDVFQPDVVFVKKEHFDVLTHAGVEGTPDFVAEILSPSNAHLDRKSKLRVYARTGVSELWLANPESRQVEVFYLQQELGAERPAAIYGESDAFSSPHFPGLDISVAAIFKPGGV